MVKDKEDRSPRMEEFNPRDAIVNSELRMLEEGPTMR